jgi:hypothetical protein
MSVANSHDSRLRGIETYCPSHFRIYVEIYERLSEQNFETASDDILISAQTATCNVT